MGKPTERTSKWNFRTYISTCAVSLIENYKYPLTQPRKPLKYEYEKIQIIA
jgi:hypothetical protein